MSRPKKNDLPTKLADDVFEKRTDQIAAIDAKFVPRGDEKKLGLAVKFLLNNSPVLRANAAASGHSINAFKWIVSQPVKRLAAEFNRGKNNKVKAPTAAQLRNALEGIGLAADQLSACIDSLPPTLRADFVPQHEVGKLLSELGRISSLAKTKAPQFAKGKGQYAFIGSPEIGLAEGCADLFNDYGLASMIKASDPTTVKQGPFNAFVANVYSYATGQDANAKGVNLAGAVKFAVRQFKQEAR